MKIGIMQGRLVRPSGNRIQEFPSKLWREELKIASKLNINLIEWVIDKKSIKKQLIAVGALGASLYIYHHILNYEKKGFNSHGQSV